MIELTQFMGEALLVNPDLMQMIEENQDTRALLTTGLVLMVQEDPVMIAQRVVDHRSAIREGREHPQAPLLDGFPRVTGRADCSG